MKFLYFYISIPNCTRAVSVTFVKRMKMLDVDNDGFKVVSGRLKIRRKIKQTNLKRTADLCDIDESVLIGRITDAANIIKTTQYFIDSMKLLKNAINKANLNSCEKIVCFGIGSFAEWQASLHQLGFILEIQKDLSIKTVEFYDPVLNTAEIFVLENFGWSPLTENCEGRYQITHSTLFYFPHCPKALVNNFLWQNWDPNLLKNAIVLGNSFSDTKTDSPERFLSDEAGYILKISDCINEIPLENTYSLPNVFNGTSIHIFLEENLRKKDESFWICGDPPVYDLTELITKDIEQKLVIS